LSKGKGQNAFQSLPQNPKFPFCTPLSNLVLFYPADHLLVGGASIPCRPLFPTSLFAGNTLTQSGTVSDFKHLLLPRLPCVIKQISPMEILENARKERPTLGLCSGVYSEVPRFSGGCCCKFWPLDDCQFLSPPKKGRALLAKSHSSFHQGEESSEWKLQKQS
jgi:hypothetical protein